MLEYFPTEAVTLKKADGRLINVPQALVSSNAIHIDDGTVPIEEGDIFERPLPNGLVERFEVTDRGFYRAWGVFPDHYQTKVRRLGSFRPEPPNQTNNYYLHGNNSRVNVNSEDRSTNSVGAPHDVFEKLIGEIQKGIENAQQRQELIALVTLMRAERGTKTFLKRYQDFVAAAANHMTVIGPLLPALTNLLASS